jgi:RNA polymerase sigma-70 factor (ECF subfamily)
MGEDSDRLLIQECLAGEQRAFAMLVGKYGRVVFNVAYRMTGNQDTAEDITQAVFVKAYENLRRYDPRYKFFSWLYRMAVNESLNYLKQSKRSEELSPSLASDCQGPDESCAERELHDKLQQAVTELAFDYRVVVVMKHYGNCSYKEMAEILGIPEKTVKSRLFTARHMLRDILAKRGILRDDS